MTKCILDELIAGWKTKSPKGCRRPNCSECEYNGKVQDNGMLACPNQRKAYIAHRIPMVRLFQAQLKEYWRGTTTPEGCDKNTCNKCPDDGQKFTCPYQSAAYVKAYREKFPDDVI